MSTIRLLLAAVVLASFAGCQRASSTETKVPVTVHVSAGSPLVKLTKGDEKTLAALIAAHKGQVIFVDYWATWCHPCVEYFPHTVEMNRKYKERGLATIAVSFDDPSDESAPRDFLAKQGADFENLLSSYDPGPAAFEGFGIDLVPHFRLYDRKGQLRHKWDAQPGDADEKIVALLAEKGD